MTTTNKTAKLSPKEYDALKAKMEKLLARLKQKQRKADEMAPLESCSQQARRQPAIEKLEDEIIEIENKLWAHDVAEAGN